MKGFRQTFKGPQQGHRFPKAHGFSGSTGAVRKVAGYMQKTPSVKKAPPPSMEGAALAPMSQPIPAPFKKGGKVSSSAAHPSGCACRLCIGGMIKKAKGGAVKKAAGGLVGQHDNPNPHAENMAWSDYKGGGKVNTKNIKKGALHAALGVPKGEKIPASKLAAAKKSSSPLERKRATFALNAKKWNHG